MLTFKRTRTASQTIGGHGDDVAYTPAVYGVFDGAMRVGYITGSSRTFMRRSEWTVGRVEASGVMRDLRGSFRTFADAKAWATKNEALFVA